MRNILVLGAAGQIGSELVPYLRNIYSADSVIATDVHDKVPASLQDAGPFMVLDALNGADMLAAVKKYNIDTIFNLVAVLSAKGEQDPTFAWKINMESLFNALEISRQTKGAVFTPSSIGAFGPTTPKDNTPQDTVMRPNTIYGVSKVAAELLGDYYHAKYGVDARGLRYPGIISYVTLPGGGTTDYAVEIYYKALQEGSYTCNLKAGSFLDMMYMPDALRAAVELMEADPSKLIHRNSFNVSAMSFDPELIAASIKKELPHFELKYDIDPIKQSIADSWPNSMDDSCARAEWNWKPEYDLDSMTKDMLAKLRLKLGLK
ncbi:MAG TPA: NAD-dependent epimerase/dehydratase family protein [Candidatus Cloacimonadota bacterium]|nr:NAD-dependent epimerase/dehydratase family protein [Candidatus Cloacimonadota bacterium]